MAELYVELGELAGGVRFPARFRLGTGPLREGVRLVDCWPGERHTYYRVETRDGDLYTLRQDESLGSWELHSYQAKRGAGVPG